MADIFLNNGDITSTIYGDVAVVESYDEITQSAVNNVLTMYGENQYHQDIGNMAYRRRLKLAPSSIATIKRDCINAIMVDDRVDEVVSIDAYYDGCDKNNIHIQFSIRSVDGTIMSSAVILTL